MNTFAFLFGARLSLRRTLILNIIMALSLCIALALVVFVHEFHDHLVTNLEDDLYLEAREITGLINPELDAYGLNSDEIRFRGTEGIYRYTVFDAIGLPVVGNEISPDIKAQILSLTPGEHRKIPLSGGRIGMGLHSIIKQRDIYVLASTYPSVSNEPKVLQIYREVKEQVVWIVLGIILILVSAMFAANRALKLLKPIVIQAKDIGPNATDKRLSTKQIPSEIAPLIDAVNGAFNRLEKGYQAQRDFSSNVAHEIRTPLAVLRSTLEGIDDPKLKKSIGDDVRRLDRMFEQMIDLSRADALGKFSHEEIDLHRLAVDLAADMGMDAIRAGKTLAVSGQLDSHAVGNRGLLSTALGNLIRNALIYSPKGTEVEVEVLSNPAGWKVMDRGVGIADSLKPMLFDRFNRGSAANQNTSGSGIGLAIVKSVADAHNAVAHIKDRAGGGSVFVFRFSDNNLI